MVREIMIGLGLAVALFLIVQGVDITPLVFAVGAFFLLRSFLPGAKGFESLGRDRKFEMAGGNPNSEHNVRTITFDDIGGQEVAKRELLEALDFVKNMARAVKLGIRPLRGIMLSGPPGTGKTLLAKAAASYTDSVFLAAAGSEFVEMYAGVGAQRVRQLFKKARSQAEQQQKTSAVVFIDEIDVLGVKRGSHASHMEYDQTLNQLLTEMDGINTRDKIKILVVAATNRVDTLDPALLRPGRFDRVVKVDLPDKEGRLHILKIHTKNKPLAPDVDLMEIARDTFGFSGAHLENLANEAAIQAMRASRDLVTMSDFKEATDKVMMGEKLDRKPGKEETRRVASHEAGHALVSELVRPNSVSTITITSRGRALGYMRQTPQDDQYLYTREELLDQIAVSLGGAVTEELIFGSRSTGSAGDFEQAVDLAKRLVYAGMSSLGVVSKENLPDKLLHEAIQQIIAETEDRVRAHLSQQREAIEEIAQVLLENEKISGDDFRRILAERSARLATA